jgi:hypothetical protein
MRSFAISIEIAHNLRGNLISTLFPLEFSRVPSTNEYRGICPEYIHCTQQALSVANRSTMFIDIDYHRHHFVVVVDIVIEKKAGGNFHICSIKTAIWSTKTDRGDR